MRNKLISLGTMVLVVLILNIWRVVEVYSLNYWLSTFIAFGLMGWWWRK